MKTIRTFALASLAAMAFVLAAPAQSWHRPAKPHENSAYFNHGRPGNRYYDHEFGRRRSDLDPLPVAFEVGYVTKRYGTNTMYEGRRHENMWGNGDKFLNGLQFGFSVQPTTACGFGFRTGLFYEIYIASNTSIHLLGYNRFVEHDLYMPFGLLYHVSTASSVSIDVSTGIGMNVAMAGVYRAWGRNGYTGRQKYGNYLEPGEGIVDGDGWVQAAPAAEGRQRADAPGYAVDERVENAIPDRVNAMWEIGVAVRYKAFKAGMNYGLGLNDQEFYEHARTRQNKFTFSLGVVF